LEGRSLVATQCRPHHWAAAAPSAPAHPIHSADASSSSVAAAFARRVSTARWLWVYVRDQRAARLITQGSSKVAR
jgi:hypothetical protein